MNRILDIRLKSLVLAAIFLGAARTSAQGPAGPPDADDQLIQRVAFLRSKIAELVDEKDLLDSLYWGWFDRPYARATLAILVKTSRVLEHEITKRRAGEGGLSQSNFNEMLDWAEDAYRRVIDSIPEGDFRPNRIRMSTRDFSAGSRPRASFCLFDNSSDTQLSPLFGDFDLIASTGFRVVARFAKVEEATANAALLRRAQSLGMSVLFDDAGCSAYSTIEDFVTPELYADSRIMRASFLWALRTIRGRDPFQYDGAAPDHPVFIPSVVSAMTGARGRRETPSSLSDWLAFWSMHRHFFPVGGSAVMPWHPPQFCGSHEVNPKQLRAAAWMFALETHALGVIEYWSGPGVLHEDSPAQFLCRPANMESIAYTALDIIRLQPVVDAIRPKPELVFVLDKSAIDLERNCNWESRLSPIWEQLFRKQILYNVNVVDSNPRCLPDYRPARIHYSISFPLRSENAQGLDVVIERVERALAAAPAHTNRVTARELDGRMAEDMYVREAFVSGDRRCVAVVNLSDRTRRLKLRGGPSLGALLDRLNNERIEKPADELSLDPWQVRLLWPEDEVSKK